MPANTKYQSFGPPPEFAGNVFDGIIAATWYRDVFEATMIADPVACEAALTLIAHIHQACIDAGRLPEKTKPNPWYCS